MVSVVVKSLNPQYPTGTHIQAILPWALYNVVTPAQLASDCRVVDPKLAPVSTAVGILGMPGMRMLIC